MKERISVVIPYSPAHTPERMLDEAKSSVREQDVDTELIVVKDSDQRGPAWARNQGLDRSDTRFVAFLDADDVWKADKLRRQLEAMSRTRAAICVEGKERDTDEFLRDLFIGRIASLTPSILLDTDAVTVRFAEQLERREDHLFILEAASEGGVCFVEDVVDVRKHDGGLSARNGPALRVRANEQFASLVADRVSADLVEQCADDFYHKLYHGVGRSAHRSGEYRSAIDYFRRAFAYHRSPRTVAACGLSLAFHVPSAARGVYDGRRA